MYVKGILFFSVKNSIEKVKGLELGAKPPRLNFFDYPRGRPFQEEERCVTRQKRLRDVRHNHANGHGRQVTFHVFPPWAVLSRDHKSLNVL